MLSRKRRTLHLTGFAYICCFIVAKQDHTAPKTCHNFCFVFVFFCLLVLFFICNIFKVKLVVSLCYLSVISDSCEPCVGGGGGGGGERERERERERDPVSLKQNRQISHFPKIDFRSKAKNIPKNTQKDNAISHIPVIQRTHIPYPYK